jgi:hypothetical protein
MAKKQGSKGGALATSPRRQKLERVDYGVYRNQKGQLTGPGGRVLPNQPSRQPDRMGQSLAEALQSVQGPGPQDQMSQMAQSGASMDQIAQAAGRQMGGMGNRPTGPISPEQMGQMMGVVSGQANAPTAADVAAFGQGNLSTRPTGPLSPAEIAQITGMKMDAAKPGQPVSVPYPGGTMINKPMPAPSAADMAAAGFGPSANQGGRYRLSPGVYGTKEQADRAYQQQLMNAARTGFSAAKPQVRKG